MAFKIDLSPTFRAEVSIDIPGEDGGIVTRKFTGVFARMSLSQLTALKDKSDMTDRDFAQSLLQGWDGMTLVTDEAGQPAAYCPEALECLLDIPGATNGIISSFYFAQAGLKKKS
jgi:hypothetical protein